MAGIRSQDPIREFRSLSRGDPLISTLALLGALASIPSSFGGDLSFSDPIRSQTEGGAQTQRPIYVMAYRQDEASEFEKVRIALGDIKKPEFLSLKAPKFVVRPIDEKWYVLCYFGSKSEAELRNKQLAAKGFEQLVNAKKPVRLFDLPPEIREQLSKPFITTGCAPNENTYLGASCNLQVDIKIGDKKTTPAEPLNYSATEYNKLWKEILDRPVPDNRKATEQEFEQISPEAMNVLEYSEVNPLVIDPHYKVGEFPKLSKVLQGATRIYYEVCQERIAPIEDQYNVMITRLLKESGNTNTDAWVIKAIERSKKMDEMMRRPVSSEAPEIGQTKFAFSLTFNVTKNGKSQRQGIGFHIFRKTPAADGAKLKP